MSEIHDECGIAAVYHLKGTPPSPLCPNQGPREGSRLLPRMLLDIQNRGQLAAGMTSYRADRPQLLETHKDVGTVSEVFRMSHRGKSESLMRRCRGRAAIGHVRYATCGADDRNYAQPFERPHIEKRKWFSFAFNGQLANYGELRDKLLAGQERHLSRDTDTEIIMHEISREMTGDRRPTPLELMGAISERFDGAYSLVLLDAEGGMIVARDPLGVKPLSYAFDGSLFAAASESVALLNLGFDHEQIKTVPPGHLISIDGREVKLVQYSTETRRAHCFFEWIYFANVASTLDHRSVYLTRTALGQELAAMERDHPLCEIDDDTIVVPVPDTSKAAADSMAFHLGVPSREGLIRNRYSGRTFIEGGDRRLKAARKYTPLREVLHGKRVFLVEDSIVRSTTLSVLLGRIRDYGGAREIHVRVACPPIISPCFYGIDMSRVSELFAPSYLNGAPLSDTAQQAMAADLGADSLRYLPVDAVARAIGLSPEHLCQGCITQQYPTPWGQKLYQIAIEKAALGDSAGTGERTYEIVRS